MTTNNEKMTTFTSSRQSYDVNITNKDFIKEIDYKFFFEYDKKPNNINFKNFDGVIISKANKGFNVDFNLYANTNFLSSIINILEKYFESKCVFGKYVVNYLNPCLENTYDKISHVQVNHYEANVFVDCVTTAINRFILKDNNVSQCILHAADYLIYKVFKNKDIKVFYIKDPDNNDTYINEFTLNKIYDSKYFCEILQTFDVGGFDINILNDGNNNGYIWRKLVEIIQNAFVHYLFRKTCGYLNSEVNVYANMIISDVAQYYNAVSNVFYETLNKLSKKISDHIDLDSKHLPRFDGIDESALKASDDIIDSNEKLVNVIDNYISTKYAELYTIISLLQSVERKSQNELANIDSPANELQAKIFQPMMLENIDLYKKLYYSFYEKYIVNGFKDQILFKDLSTVVNKFVNMQIKSYNGELLRHSIYCHHPKESVIKEYESGFVTKDLPISESKLHEMIDSCIFNASGKNYYEKTYGSKYSELKDDIFETLKDILVKIDNIIRYQFMFECRINEWACYLVNKAEQHVNFDVVDDCKKALLSEYSSLNHFIVRDMMNKTSW